MSGSDYTPHNPRTAAVLISLVERHKRQNYPAWDESLDVSDNWRRICNHEYEGTKTLLCEVKKLDWENNELRQLLVHHLGRQGEEFITALDNAWPDDNIHQAIADLDNPYASPYAANMSQEEIQRLIFED